MRYLLRPSGETIWSLTRRKPLEYPLIATSHSGTTLILKDFGCGVVVTQGMNTVRSIGTYTDTWRMERFYLTFKKKRKV